MTRIARIVEIEKRLDAIEQQAARNRLTFELIHNSMNVNFDRLLDNMKSADNMTDEEIDKARDRAVSIVNGTD